jgi:hypothetical protein
MYSYTMKWASEKQKSWDDHVHSKEKEMEKEKPDTKRKSLKIGGSQPTTSQGIKLSL